MATTKRAYDLTDAHDVTLALSKARADDVGLGAAWRDVVRR
jgi:hypothetical protein